MRSTSKTLGTLGRSVLCTCLVVLAPSILAAQVGLTSRLAQVSLVARSLPAGSIQGVSLRDSSVALRISANSSYKLVARSSGVSTSRIWVRSVAGNFEELKAGVPVVVAQGLSYFGDSQVQYRVETPAGQNQKAAPMVYDLVIAPTM